MSTDHIYAVILAGGSGTRFWPKSRQTSPKQLCHIGDCKDTLLATSLSRLDQFIPLHRRLVVTNSLQFDETKALVGHQCLKILSEPLSRNTAAAIALAALEIKKIHKDNSTSPIMISLHADHVIKNQPAFIKDLKNAVTIANKDYLTLLGIPPRKADSGFGYIRKGEVIAKDLKCYRVKSFHEKPTLSKAEEYFQSKEYYWNSGLFVWRIDTILSEFENYLPDTLKQLQEVLKNQSSFENASPAELARAYKTLENVAIDHAILEKSQKVAVIETDFDWYDIGNWAAVSECFETDRNGNLIYGDVLAIDCENTVIDTDSMFIAALGIKDLVVVCAKGAILVCPKDQAQNVKNIVTRLKELKRSDLI